MPRCYLNRSPVGIPRLNIFLHCDIIDSLAPYSALAKIMLFWFETSQTSSEADRIVHQITNELGLLEKPEIQANFSGLQAS